MNTVGWIPAFRRRSSRYRRTTKNALNDEYSDETSRSPGSASVGDYVKGVHGGKYQFDGPGAPSLAAREFTEQLYSSSEYDNALDATQEDEPWPRWADSMGESMTQSQIDAIAETLLLEPGGQPVSIQVKNQERTWEPFYVKFIGVTAGALPPTIRCVPLKGTLAPRGGSVNLCDPSKPYSDQATVTVSLVQEAETMRLAGTSWYMIIGTEEEKWYYKVVIQ